MMIKALPGARKNQLRVGDDGQVRVSVTQTAEHGKANEAIVGLLSESLGIAKSRIEVLRGTTGRKKTVLLRACQLEKVLQQLVPQAHN